MNKDWLKYLSGIVKEIGIIGFIVVIIVAIFLIWATPDQKREFIDSYILLKNNNPYHCVIIVVFLASLMIIGTIYYQKMLNLRKKENNRIGQKKSEWQEKALEKQLKSSE